MSRTIKVLLQIYDVDASGNVINRPAIVDQEWTVDLAVPQAFSVPANAAATVTANTGAVANGITDPSIVLVHSPDQVVTVAPGSPVANLFLAARFDGGDCLVNTVGLTTIAGSTTEAQAEVYSAGEHV